MFFIAFLLLALVLVVLVFAFVISKLIFSMLVLLGLPLAKTAMLDIFLVVLILEVFIVIKCS